MKGKDKKGTDREEAKRDGKGRGRKEQKDKIEEFLLSNENDLRKKLNLPTFSSYKEFMDSDDDPDQLNVESEILGEAANILIDLIEIKNEPVFALNDKAYTQ